MKLAQSISEQLHVWLDPVKRKGNVKLNFVIPHFLTSKTSDDIILRKNGSKHLCMGSFLTFSEQDLKT